MATLRDSEEALEMQLEQVKETSFRLCTPKVHKETE